MASQPEVRSARTSRYRCCDSHPGRVQLEADFLLRSDCCGGRGLRQEREDGYLRDAPEHQKSSGGENPRHDIRLFQWWLIGRSHFTASAQSLGVDRVDHAVAAGPLNREVAICQTENISENGQPKLPDRLEKNRTLPRHSAC